MYVANQAGEQDALDTIVIAVVVYGGVEIAWLDRSSSCRVLALEGWCIGLGDCCRYAEERYNWWFKRGAQLSDARL